MLKSNFAGILVLVALVLASVPAFACSPTQELARVEFAEVGTPTTIAFKVSGYGEAQASLADANGDVPGTLENLLDAYVFRPDVPLTPGIYTLTVDTPSGEVETQSVEIEIRESADVALELEISPFINQGWTDVVCCSTDVGGCMDTCGGSCTSCWPAGYEYSKGLEVKIGVVEPRLIEVRLRDGSLVQSSVVLTEGNFALRDGELDAPETCVDITVSSLEGSEIATDMRCVPGADFPETELIEPDAPEQVAACAEPPDDETDPNWQRYGAPRLKQDAGGCSSTGASSSASFWLLIAALVLMRQRFAFSRR